MAITDELYDQKLGLKKVPEVWEDGMRTTGKENSFEWWYFDAECDDGSKVVVVFYTKNGFDFYGPPKPTVSLDITFPDGKKLIRSFTEGEGALIHSAKDKCDVQIGDSKAKYIDGNYVVHFKDEEVDYTCTMKSVMPMWRSGTGHSFFGDNQYFAWFVAQPIATVESTLIHKGITYHLKGRGYHDHNWGNVAMERILNHWYWCRANIGPYTVVTSDIIAEKAYNYRRSGTFFLARDRAVVADDRSKVEVIRNDTVYHPVTGKFIDNDIIFKYTDGDEVYTIEYKRDHDIIATSLLDMLQPEMKEQAIKMGMNPTYLRIIGTVTLTAEKGEKKEVYEQEGLWEQMFFGSNKDAIFGE